MKKRTSLLVCLLLAVSWLCAQHARQFSFSRYNTATGLISNQINAVIQDSTGYLWIGTTEGLQRFDGTRYKSFVFNRKDSSAIPPGPVLELMIDRKGRLWVLYSNSTIGIFDTNTLTFTEAKVVVEDPKWMWAEKRLLQDNFGNIFYLLRGVTFLTYDNTTNTFSTKNNFIHVPEGLGVVDLVQQPGTRKYWLSLFGAGIGIYNLDTRHFNHRDNNPDNEPAIKVWDSTHNPGHIFFDKSNRLWYDTWGAGIPYLFCFDLLKNRPYVDRMELIEPIKSYHEIFGFFVQQDGTVWVRGLKVLARFLEKEKKFQLVYNGYLNERSIFYDGVNSMHEDRENNIWIGTKTNGLYRFNPTAELFTNVNHIHRGTGRAGDGDVMSFAKTKWGTYLVGTWGDGVYHYDRDFNLIPTNIKGKGFEEHGPSIWSMYPSRDSNIIWMSAQPGIYKFDQNKRAVTFYDPPILKTRTVRQIIEDQKGNLWFSLQGSGLFKWDANKGQRNFNDGVYRIAALPPLQFNDIFVDRKGFIWAASSSEGVFVINPDTDSVVMRFGKTGAPSHRLNEDGVSSMLEFDDSLVIINTSTTIHIYNRVTRTTRMFGRPGTLSGYIASVERDDNGYLWVSTTSGLNRVNFRNNVIVRFVREDGIDNDYFILGASKHLPGDTMLFGASNQFVIFRPGDMKFHAGFSRVAITDFRVMNRYLSVDSLMKLKKVTLGPTDNSITVDFSSLNYNNPYLIRYKLEGLDKEWKFADRTNQAIYSYLPPGTYTLLLGTIDNEGVPDKNITRLVITISPPFWKTWWFYSLLALFTAVLLFRFDRERMKRKEALQKMRTDIAGNLHEKVSTALNNINILSEMARLKADKDPQKSKEYIEQIHNKSSNMIIAMDDMLWSIDHENDNMAKTVERMKEYVDALRNRHGVNIDILVDKNVESLQLNMKLRYEAFLVFKEGIKNLVTTGATNCSVYIGLEKSKLLFTTQFDNECCNLQELNNLLHRRDLEERLESMDARISIQIHKASSVISMQIPVS